MIKAVFFDIDGTLVSFKTHQVSELTNQALEKLKENDIKIFIATGRHQSILTPICHIDFDGFVTLNGQVVFAGEERIFANIIPKEDIRQALAVLKEKPYPCYFVEDRRMYLNFVNEDVMTVQEEVQLPLPDIEDVSQALDRDIFELIAYISEENEHELLDQLPHCKGARWHPLFTDIVPKEGGKVAGMEELLRHFDLKWDEVMAIGDGQNDLEMIKKAKIGVAMGNAHDKVKQAADYATLNDDEDGIVAALKHFKLI